MWTIRVRFHPHQSFMSNPVFLRLLNMAKLPKNEIKHGIRPVKTLSITNKMDRAAFVFNLITSRFVERYWNEMAKIDAGMLEKKEGLFTLNELLFPLELSGSPPSAVRWSELFSHRRTIRGSKKMISLCYVPAIFRGVKAFQRSVHINSPARSKQAHTRFTAGQVPPGSRVSRDSLRSGVLLLGSMQHCGVSLTLGYGSKC